MHQVDLRSMLQARIAGRSLLTRAYYQRVQSVRLQNTCWKPQLTLYPSYANCPFTPGPAAWFRPGVWQYGSRPGVTGHSTGDNVDTFGNVLGARQQARLRRRDRRYRQLTVQLKAVTERLSLQPNDKSSQSKHQSLTSEIANLKHAAEQRQQAATLAQLEAEMKQLKADADLPVEASGSVLGAPQQGPLQMIDSQIKQLTAELEAATEQLSLQPNDEALQWQRQLLIDQIACLKEEAVAAAEQDAEYRQQVAKIAQLKAQIQQLKAEGIKLSMADMFQLPLPPIKYQPPSANPNTGRYPSTLVSEVWYSVEDDISKDVDRFIADQPSDKRFQPIQAFDLTHVSEESIVGVLIPAVDAVQAALQYAHSSAFWYAMPERSTATSSGGGISQGRVSAGTGGSREGDGAMAGSTSPNKRGRPKKGEAGKSSDGDGRTPAGTGPQQGKTSKKASIEASDQVSTPLTALPLEEQDQLEVKKKPVQLDVNETMPPDWVLHEDGVCCTFVEVITPHVLEQASTASLATLRVESSAKPGAVPRSVPDESSQGSLDGVLGQAEAYCRDKRCRYCAITTYNVTWVCKVQGNSLLISKGFRYDSTDPTILKVLLWLSLKALGPDGKLGPDELPPIQATPSGDGSLTAQDTAGANDAVAAADTSADSEVAQNSGDDADTENSKTNILQWFYGKCDCPTLGTGMTGDVLPGRLKGREVAVKQAPQGSKLAWMLYHEGSVYLALKPLQGKFIPEMLACTPAAGDKYMLITARLYARELSGGGADASLLPKALEALRAVHQAGYLHGDVRLPNFMVVQDRQELRVMVLDFGRAVASTSKEDMQAEEELLTSLLARKHM